MLARLARVLLLPKCRPSQRATSVGAMVLLLAWSVAAGRAAAGLERTAGVSATSTPAAEDWALYQSQHGHFELDHPTTWTAAERIDQHGALITTFTAPSGAAISVVVQSGPQRAPDNSDLMNTRCRAVTVSGQAARTCFDTISFALITTVAGDARTYRIIGSRRRVDQRIYDRLLSSFRMLP